MLQRIIPALVFLTAVHGGLAASPDGCAGNILGAWQGPVLDGGHIRRLATEFMLRDGDLIGRYHVDDDAGGYDGTLTDFSSRGGCSGWFVWHDRYGSGIVLILFRPEAGRFDGQWGNPVPDPNNIFDGRRIQPVPSS